MDPSPIDGEPRRPLSELIQALSFIEQLIAAEHQWIANRLSWLFVSQSFCIMAFTILVTSTGVRFSGDWDHTVLRIGLPSFGIACCLSVAVSVIAAARVAQRLSAERARLTRHVNQELGIRIPLIGPDPEYREPGIGWTFWAGAVPRLLLPWLLAALWTAVLVY